MKMTFQIQHYCFKNVKNVYISVLFLHFYKYVRVTQGDPHIFPSRSFYDAKQHTCLRNFIFTISTEYKNDLKTTLFVLLGIRKLDTVFQRHHNRCMHIYSFLWFQ